MRGLARVCAPAIRTFEPPKNDAGRIVRSLIGSTVTSTNAAAVGSLVRLPSWSLSRGGKERKKLIRATRTFRSHPHVTPERFSAREWAVFGHFFVKFLGRQNDFCQV